MLADAVRKLLDTATSYKAMVERVYAGVGGQEKAEKFAVTESTGGNSHASLTGTSGVQEGTVQVTHMAPTEAFAKRLAFVGEKVLANYAGNVALEGLTVNIKSTTVMAPPSYTLDQAQDGTPIHGHGYVQTFTMFFEVIETV